MTTVPDSISLADGSPAPLKVEDADVINSPEEPKPPSTPSGWDPDDEQAMRTRFLRTIIAEREKRHQEILLMNKEKEIIAYQQQNLLLEQRNLEARLQEVNKYRDILPSAKQLHEMGVEFLEIVIWIELIRDKAATEGITPKEAVALIVQELKLYNQFNSLKRSVERVQQDLEALNIVIEERKGAIASLVDLKSNYGVTEGQIVQLINFAGEWNKYWQSSTTNDNLQQPMIISNNQSRVNGSNNPGSSDGNFSGNNGYGGNFSINDLVRLNYYKYAEQNRSEPHYDKLR